MTRLICVTSGKRGVGKTTTAINLAAALHKTGQDVLLVDGDLLNPKIYTHFGNRELKNSLYDVLEEKIDFLESVHEHDSGLRIIPTQTTMERAKDIDADKLKQFLLSLKNHSKTIIIDSAASLEEEAMAAIEASEEVLVVTNPNNEAMPDALNTLKKVQELNKTILGVVVNQRKNETELSEHEISLFLETPVISKIPFDMKIKKSKEKKHPVVHSHPKSKSSKEFRKLALKLH